MVCSPHRYGIQVSDSSIENFVASEYSAGFVTEIETETLPPGLDESVVRFISAKKDEPEWLTQWRLKAFAGWRAMTTPEWGHVHFPPIDFEAISYYSAPKSQADGPTSLDEVDPELLRTYEKLGIPLHEQEALAGVVKDSAGGEGKNGDEHLDLLLGRRVSPGRLCSLATYRLELTRETCH